MPGQARLVAFIAATAAMAAVAVSWAFWNVDPQPTLWIVLAVFVGEWYATRLRESVFVSLTNTLSLVAVLLGGPALAIVAMLGALPAFAIKASDMRVLRTAFNGGQYILAAALSGFAYEWLLSLSGAAFPAVPALFAILAAAMIHSTVNHALVAGVVTIAGNERYWDTFRTIGPSLVMEIPYSGIAILTVVVMQSASPLAVLLLVVPAMIARKGLLAFQRVDDSYDQLVRTFVDTIEMKDRYTRGHSERVATLSVSVAEELGITYEERRLTRYAALLHDVGKVGIPLCIINKPGRLDDDEFSRMKDHPSIGADILRDIDFLEPALDIVRFHHERLDGRGYPYGVPGERLSRIVRIVTVADAFDAMTSTRSYRRAMPVADAVAELRRCAGAQFDPECVEALATAVARDGWESIESAAPDVVTPVEDIPLGTAEERIERAAEGRPERTPGDRVGRGLANDPFGPRR